MDSLDQIQEAIRIAENKEKLSSAVCTVCGENEELYICRDRHKTIVCKKCLSKDKKNNVIDFCTKEFRPLINQEEDITCSFVPLIPKVK